MDVALSPNGRRLMRVFFALVVVFLYAPIAILLVFSFNSSPVPVFPLSGFTLGWYHDFLTNADIRGSLETSAIIAAVSSVGACSARSSSRCSCSGSRWRSSSTSSGCSARCTP